MEEFKEVNRLWQMVQEMAIAYAPKLILAIVLLVVGFKVIRKLTFLFQAAMVRAGISENLLPFLSSLAGISLKILLLITVASVVGIDVTSFLAVLAAAGFAVGLALQGSLSNFAAGIIVLIFRPYKIGEWIEVDEKFGQVEEIQIFNTLIVTPGKKTLIIPNSKVIDNVVTNYSRKGFIRLDLSISMPYAESFPKVREILLDAISSCPKVLTDPAPEVGILSFDEFNVSLSLRPFVRPDDYWAATFDIHARVKMAFYEHGIAVAYPETISEGPVGA